MRSIVYSWAISALAFVAANSGAAHAAFLRAEGDGAMAPPPPATKNVLVGKPSFTLSAWHADDAMNSMLTMTHPFYTHNLGDSLFFTGRAALATQYASGGAITFDYSGTEIFGQLIGQPGVTYSVGAAFNYPCITVGSGRGGNLLAVYIDDAYVTTVDFGSYFTQQQCEKDVVMTFGYDLLGTHSVRFVKITEPNYNSRVDNAYNNITFIRFQVRSTVPVQLAPLTPKALKMEFVGDSITCGYMINCKAPMDPSIAPYTLENVLESYSGVTCKNLDAQCHYVSWSGRGMSMNLYDGSALVSDMYNYTMATVLNGDEASLWDFSLYTPDIVVINLGTNDFGNPAMKNSTANVEAYVDRYARFMAQVGLTYGAAKVSIVAICGPMSYAYCASVEGAIAKVSAANPSMRKPYFLQLDNTLTPDDRCAGHPGAEISVTIAKQVTDFINATVIPNM